MDEEGIKLRMQQVVELVARDVASIRTGRASTSLVSDIVVSVYGGTQRLKVCEVASVNVVGAELITIDPWDKSIIGEIRNGILVANVGLNPSLDGEIIRISIPPLTHEDREKYVKLLSSKLEAGRVMVRQVRGDAMHDIKKSFEEKEISEDEKFSFEKVLQDLTDQHISQIEELGEKKKAELLSI